MITPGSKAPAFNVKACVSIEKGKEFSMINSKDFEGKWVVFYTYPKDFTFVCPTEIVEFDKKLKDLADRGATLLGGSTDNEFSHLAWRQQHADLSDAGPGPPTRAHPKYSCHVAASGSDATCLN